jgi:hypothetical protein
MHPNYGKKEIDCAFGQGGSFYQQHKQSQDD